jgi:hypothetical protein
MNMRKVENQFHLYKYYRNRMNRALDKILIKLNRNVKS